MNAKLDFNLCTEIPAVSRKISIGDHHTGESAVYHGSYGAVLDLSRPFPVRNEGQLGSHPCVITIFDTVPIPFERHCNIFLGHDCLTAISPEIEQIWSFHCIML